MKLLGNRALIEIVPEPAGIGLIQLPDNLKPRPHFGVIRQLGTARRGQPGVTHAGHLLSELKEGDLVRINSGMGSVEVEHEGRPMHVVSTLDILAVIE